MAISSSSWGTGWGIVVLVANREKGFPPSLATTARSRHADPGGAPIDARHAFLTFRLDDDHRKSGSRVDGASRVRAGPRVHGNEPCLRPFRRRGIHHGARACTRARCVVLGYGGFLRTRSERTAPFEGPRE